MSAWKERAIARRDERQTKVQSVRPPAPSKKNTKKWCRGKVGREHKPVCVPYDEWENRPEGSEFAKDWKLLVCSECEKQLDYWWPTRLFKDSRPQPDWTA